MNESGPGLTLRCAEQSVLAAAIRLLLSEVAPGIGIDLLPADQCTENCGIRVDYGPQRWMCILHHREDVEAARDALRAGAWSIATLDDDLPRFRQSVDDLITGRPHQVPVALARRLTAPTTAAGPETTAHVRLTRREREVLRLLTTGLSNGAIADALGISIHTVRTHLSSMATKIEEGNRLRMVMKARALGYTEAGG